MNEKQLIADIKKMSTKNKYNHILSALEVVLQGNRKSQEHRDATNIIRTHIRIHKSESMGIAGITYK